MAGLNKLAERMRAKAKSIPTMASDLAVKVTKTIVNDLAYATPVDESTAISNWQVQLNTPVQQEIRAYFPGSKGSTYSASAQATVENAEAELAGKKPGQPIYLSNVLRYIVPLNNGSSTQAPAGYVERSVLLGRLVVRGKI